MNAVLGYDSTLVRLCITGDNMGYWDEFCYESCSWCRIDRLTCSPVVQCATTVPRVPPLKDGDDNGVSVVINQQCVFGIDVGNEPLNA